MSPWQFNGVVRLTKIGVSFIVFTILAGFAAINTGNNALYIALSLMLGALMLSGIASKGGLKHLRVEFESVDEAWAGRVARGRLRVVNRSRIWNVRDLIVTSGELAAPILVSLVPRRGDVAIDAAFLFRRRGLVQLTSIDLYTRYPFGFFLKKRRVTISGDVVVYPHLLDEDVAREYFSLAEGDQHPSIAAGPRHRRPCLPRVHARRLAAPRGVEEVGVASAAGSSSRPRATLTARCTSSSIRTSRARRRDDDFERMVSEAATFLRDALHRDLEVILVHAARRRCARTVTAARAIFRALALLEPRYEPFAQTLERDSVVFAVRRADERKTRMRSKRCSWPCSRPCRCT